MENVFGRVWRAIKGEETPPPAASPPSEHLLAAARDEGMREATRIIAEEIQRQAARQPIPLIPTTNTPSPYGAYAMDSPITFSTPQPPNRRPKALVSVDTLRQLADTYDVLRACINHLKREVATTKFEVVSRDQKDTRLKTKKRCREAMDLFGVQGGIGGYGSDYRHFETKMLEDALVVGAAAIWHERDRGGRWLSSVEIDAATIRPWTDAYGWTPKDTGPYSDHVYEQWIYGVMTGFYSRADLSYDGLWSVSWKPYFVGAVEWLIYVINGALSADAWNRSWLVDGDTPSDMTALPETWGAEQVINWQKHWDALMAGNPLARSKMKFVPGGTEKVGSNTRHDQEFAAFETWLMRRTCSIMGVSPTAIGHEGQTYKVSQEGSQQQTTQFGAGSLLAFRKARLDDILERAGYGDLEVQDVDDGAASAKEKADTNKILIESGQRTINEVRQDQGQEPVDGGDVLLVSTTVQTLETLTDPPEPLPPLLPPTGPGGPGGPPAPEPPAPVNEDQRAADLGRWQRKAIGRLKAGKSPICDFESGAIPAERREAIERGLAAAETADEVRAAFEE